MLAQIAAAERLGKMKIDEFTVPSPLTGHAVRILVSCKKIALNTALAGCRWAVRTRHLAPQERRVIFKTDLASHFTVYRPKKWAQASIFIAP
jgi:hypothetical protein